MLMAKPNATTTLTSTDQVQKIDLSKMELIGSQLSISNGGILIEKDVKKIKVSATILVNVSGSGTYNLYIYKNSEYIARAIRSGSGNVTNNITEKIVDVAKGDIIYVYISASSGSTVNANERISHLIVEVVE